jgi:SAM-dependent methyltransferase
MLAALIWPLPALVVWGLAWALFLGLAHLGASLVVALLAASCLGVALSVLGKSSWRRLIIAAGFPLSLAISGVMSVSAWVWLLPLALLLLLYPINAWRDAPLFPTPENALLNLPDYAPLPPEVRVLDAGCGLGHGLQALRLAYPLAKLEGLEWSWPLRWLCALRCPWAQVRQGDIWQADWSVYALVYVFQRPESMPLALEKARRQMRPGTWLVSLEFAVPGVTPHRTLKTPQGRSVWVYRLG